MKRWNFSLIVKITGIVFIAFAIVLGNEIRLGIDRYIKNTLETDANATAKDLDKFYKSYSESTIINTPDLSSKSFDKIYSTALAGDSSKVKCLVDKDGKILDISREQVGEPIISITIKEYKGSSNLPIYFDLESLPDADIELIEHKLLELENDIIEVSIDVESLGLDYINQYNSQKIKSISFNDQRIFTNEKVTETTETITGIISYYSSYNLEMTFPPVSLEAYNKSISKKTSGDNIKPVVYDYQNVT
ncbi:MAG: sensor histidine kinase, partial [Coprobacillus sp.]